MEVKETKCRFFVYLRDEVMLLLRDVFHPCMSF